MNLYRQPQRGQDPAHSARTIRDRQAALDAAIDRAGLEPSHGTARRLVQIFDGGSMPTAADHFFLAHPVELDGAETEGGTGGPAAQSGTMAVDLLGGIPSVGDLLVAYAVGGRWVAERGAATSVGSCCGAACSPCPIPLKDLTLSWTNLISGPGSTTLTYTPSPNVWKTGCVDDQIYELLCSSGTIVLAVTYFISGECPTGQSQRCSSTGAYPLALVRSSYTCTPFSVTYTVAPGCPEVEAPGYTSFTITDPAPSWTDPDVPHCCVTICVGVCGPPACPASGATVTVNGVTATTDSSGSCVRLDIGTPGTYSISVTGADGFSDQTTASFPIACCNTYQVFLPPVSGNTCCGCCSLNASETLTMSISAPGLPATMALGPGPLCVWGAEGGAIFGGSNYLTTFTLTAGRPFWTLNIFTVDGDFGASFTSSTPSCDPLMMTFSGVSLYFPTWGDTITVTA